MIITVTCNPAIDKTVYEDKTIFDVGGKGINVSKVLHELSTPSIATGFIGKDNKNVIIDDLNRLGIENHFIDVDGKVRTNTKYIENGNLKEFNEDGPYISNENINEMYEYLSKFSNEIIVISGSVPSCVDKNFYKELIIKLKQNNNFVILDTSKELLKNSLEAKPNIIKPNKDEICELLNIEYDLERIIEKCKDFNLDLICVSLGSEGAVFIGEEVFKYDALPIKCLSSVGAGDAMVAAIAYGKQNNMPLKSIAKLAMACSAASCLQEGTKPANYATIKVLFDSL